MLNAIERENENKCEPREKGKKCRIREIEKEKNVE
jgi:hypothetical protein